MAKRMVEESSLQMVADAIREKAGTEETLVFPEEFAAAIGKISGGGTDEVDAILSGTVTELYNDRIATINSLQNSNLLTSVDLPNVITVNTSCFTNCLTLKTANLPKATHIGNSGFHGCRELESVYVPLVKSVGSNGFNGCKVLQRLELPTATTIYVNAFYDCQSLHTLILSSATMCSLASVGSTFKNTPIENGTGYIYVPDDLVDSYKVATNWITFADQFRPMSELEVA